MGVSGRGYVVSPVLATAVGAGLDAMGVEDVEVIVTADFNQTVRELTGSQNYTASRGDWRDCRKDRSLGE